MQKPFNQVLFRIMLFVLVPLAGGNASTDLKSPGISPAEALDKLKKGNQRYVSEKRFYPNQDSKTRKNTADKGQFPFASVLGCSDSRAPVEHIFDAGVGEIFTIRVAGNVSDTDEIGTMEYGIGHLNTPVLVVLGHTKCGAVTAVVKGDKVHGSIPELVDNIVPAVERAKKKSGSAFSVKLVDDSIRENVWQSIEDLLKRSEEARHLVEGKKLMIVGALYNIENGEVEWLGEHPGQASLITHKSDGHLTFGKYKSQLIFNGILLGIFLISFFLFIGKNRLVKGVQVKGRMIASFFVIIISIGFVMVWEIYRNAGHGAHADRGETIVSVSVSLLLAMIFAFIYINSIIGSFKRVIGILKSAAVSAGDIKE